MPKAILIFTLPEEKCEFRIATHAMDFAMTCWDLDQQLRDWLKYGHEFKTANEALEKARESLNEFLNSYGVSLDMIE